MNVLSLSIKSGVDSDSMDIIFSAFNLRKVPVYEKVHLELRNGRRETSALE